MNKRILKKQNTKRLCNKLDDILLTKQDGALLLISEKRLNGIDEHSFKVINDIVKKHNISLVFLALPKLNYMSFDKKSDLIEELEKLIVKLKN